MANTTVIFFKATLIWWQLWPLQWCWVSQLFTLFHTAYPFRLYYGGGGFQWSIGIKLVNKKYRLLELLPSILPCHWAGLSKSLKYLLPSQTTTSVPPSLAKQKTPVSIQLISLLSAYSLTPNLSSIINILLPEFNTYIILTKAVSKCGVWLWRSKSCLNDVLNFCSKLA